MSGITRELNGIVKIWLASDVEGDAYLGYKHIPAGRLVFIVRGSKIIMSKAVPEGAHLSRVIDAIIREAKLDPALYENSAVMFAGILVGASLVKINEPTRTEEPTEQASDPVVGETQV